ncbi:MAG TPA: NAD(P)/FAD-dependent oxidoreductase [Desulfuromonadales bacterium]|nr:NAD(P)/FAD-dependent oxidoreductase [Desulfuromonadales bacterium]
MAQKRVVIAGMGFGGLRAAKELAGSGVELTLVDRHNYHLFQPLLYQVATAGLEQEAIAYPLRALTRKWDQATFVMAEIVSINLSGRTVVTDGGELPYDYLVIAAGSRTNFFGMESVQQNSFDLKSLAQAEVLRNHILIMFERASRERDSTIRSALLTFVIVGGGPTGVEFAGALRELIVYVLAKDYPSIATEETRIVLVEAADSLLTALPEKLRLYAAEKLRNMGVEIQLQAKVVGASSEAVEFSDGSRIASHTLLWSAGVAASKLAGTLTGVQFGSSGRVVVQPDLTLAEYPDVFVIGDMACCQHEGGALPMMAPVAIQQGVHAARAIKASLRGETLPAFRYFDKGAMATIGKSSAVATAKGFSFSGYLAWLAWLLLHLYYLIGFRNRAVVMMSWTYAYWFQDRQIRLITTNRRRSSQFQEKHIDQRVA